MEKEIKMFDTLVITGYEWRHTTWTMEEIRSKIRWIQRFIIEFFDWDKYPGYTHLVYAVKYDGRFVIYSNGYLMDDEEFVRMIVNRKDLTIERVWAYHKLIARS